MAMSRLAGIKSWGTTEGVCMIAAVMPMMDEKQWEYMTMGNTRDVREVYDFNTPLLKKPWQSQQKPLTITEVPLHYGKSLFLPFFIHINGFPSLQ